MLTEIKRNLFRNLVASILIFASLLTAAGAAPQAAAAAAVFPGAQGYGVDSPAGRGGAVLKVTNLNADGPGSFKAALETKGPRIIVFEVGGVIDLNKKTLVAAEPYVTIAGQTAPSPGITFIRGGLQIKTHDVLMKHIRFRMGDAGAAKGSGYEPDVSTYGANAYHIVIDHCSFAWGVDETLSASGPRFDGPSGTSRKLTFSNNIIAEGLHDSVHEKGPHSMGTLIHDYVNDAALVGNLFAHNDERNPWFKGFATGVIVNNVIHNPGKWAIRLGYVPGEWTSSSITPQGPKVSIVGNYMKHGADTVSGLGLVGTNSNSGEAYLADNKALDRTGKAVPQTFGGVKLLGIKPSWPSSGLTVRPSGEVLSYVTQHAGARPKDRDTVDRRIVTDTLNGTGRILDSQNEVGGYPSAAPAYRALAVPAAGIDEWLHQFSVELE
ncbi:MULTISPECIES: pectate lyase family protein [Paenibacillus]|uniref:pectate lyase family protein n=1 Tax=Paenibacillus TaxID=44249 RepID=UPI0022B8F4AA|nr:right-handed parallel beta-helix repeat-containing protein [Paenibacillus caseinilyticus]MCZ8521600.1 right-handed parallel beta-helix repeat-containing protein [Paenibacillus caseinilyticus]